MEFVTDFLRLEHPSKGIISLTKTTMVKKAEKKEKVEPVAEMSPAQIEYRKIIEAYAISNPVKYEMKKEELEAKYNAIV